jgi:hypothetical protein
MEGDGIGQTLSLDIWVGETEILQTSLEFIKDNQDFER